MAKASSAVLIASLEDSFRRVSLRLYDTRVDSREAQDFVRPHLADDVTFIDPWQTARGRDKYLLGLAGFHHLLKFDLEILQLNVQLDEKESKGRALVDCIMHLKLLAPFYTYPLRTILAYDFTDAALDKGSGLARFLIVRHEEMWSLGDMIESTPLVGPLYAKLFRPAFSYGFLAASAIASGETMFSKGLRLLSIRPRG